MMPTVRDLPPRRRVFIVAGLALLLHGCLTDGFEIEREPMQDRNQEQDQEADRDAPPSPVPPPSTAPGGFIEESTTTIVRPLLTPIEIENFLPERGGFRFPEPYNTHGVRITNAADCGGSDCVNYVGYSYWRNMNNHVDSEEILIVIGLSTARGGDGPTLFRYHKESGDLVKDGPLFEPGSRFSNATAEGWYFSATMPTVLYMRDGAKLVRFDVVDRTSKIVFDATTEFGGDRYIWQTHSSNDDRVHSAALRDTSTEEQLGCMVYDESTSEFHYFERSGMFEECQIDKSGDYLLIKEQISGEHGSDSRIVNLATGEERVLLNEDGGGGHSDMGYASVVKADNWANEANTWRLWDFTAESLRGKRVYHNTDWSIASPNHVSFAHAREDLPLEDQYVCGSGANKTISPQANDIICFTLDGSGKTLVVAPVMTDLNALAGGGDYYSQLPKGNLDVTGRYFLWTSNMGGDRLDAFLVKVPSQRLMP
jgi:hypothetical protein